MGFQERRAKVDDTVLNEFMTPRPLEWKGNPKVPRADLVAPVVKEGEQQPTEGDGKMTKNQLKKMLKAQQMAERKAEKTKEKEAKATASEQ